MAMQQVNFYQAQFRPQQLVFSVQKVAMFTALTMLILLVFGFYFSQKIIAQKSVISQQKQRVNTSHNQLLELQQQLANRGSDELLSAQYTVLQQKLNKKKSIYDYLSSHHFGNRDGFSSLLESLSQQRINNVWLTEFSLLDAGKNIALYGNTKQSSLIPEYIDSLAQSAQFKGQQFSVFEVQKPSNTLQDYQFKLHTAHSDKAGR